MKANGQATRPVTVPSEASQALCLKLASSHYFLGEQVDLIEESDLEFAQRLLALDLRDDLTEEPDLESERVQAAQESKNMPEETASRKRAPRGDHGKSHPTEMQCSSAPCSVDASLNFSLLI